METELEFDWYLVLGVDSTATPDQIQKSSRQLSFKYHPDKTTDPEAPDLFLKVQKAKEILLHEESRKKVDIFLLSKNKRKIRDEARSEKMDSERKSKQEKFQTRLSEALSSKRFSTENIRRKTRDQMNSSSLSPDFTRDMVRTILIKWNSDYKPIDLKRQFQKFGLIQSILFISKTSARISYFEPSMARRAIDFHSDNKSPYDVHFDYEIDSQPEPKKVKTFELFDQSQIQLNLIKEVLIQKETELEIRFSLPK